MFILAPVSKHSYVSACDCGCAAIFKHVVLYGVFYTLCIL